MQQVNAVIPLSFACANPIFPPFLTPSILLHPPASAIHSVCTRSTNPIDVPNAMIPLQISTLVPLFSSHTLAHIGQPNIPYDATLTTDTFYRRL